MVLIQLDRTLPLRRIVPLVALFVLLGIAGILLFGGSLTGWRNGGRDAPITTVDRERVRDRGADIAEKAADASTRVRETMQDAAVTTKIKAKMALDDTIKARAI